MKLKVSTVVIFVLLIQFPSTAIHADSTDISVIQASTQLKSWNIPLSENCKGRVDRPHISRHVKGTVNVVLSINCPKQFLSITGVLFRDPVKVPADLKLGHVSGRNQVKLNLAVPCLTNEGASNHAYFITATFLATGHFPVSKTYSWPVEC